MQRTRMPQGPADGATLPGISGNCAARRVRMGIAAAGLVLLVACGGGGGGGTAVASVTAASPAIDSGAEPLEPSPGPPEPAEPPSPPPPSEPPAPPDPSVPLVAPGSWVVMGSSTALGAGAGTLSWYQALQASYANIGVQFFNIARSGAATYQGLPTGTVVPPLRPQPDPTSNVTLALSFGPKLVVLGYPSNDTASGYPVDETVNHLLAIRQAARAGGAAVIVIGTQPRDLAPDLLSRLPQIDARLAAAVGPCFVAVREALAGADGKIAPAYDVDGIHVNDAGHAVIHAKLREVIDSRQCVRVGT